MYKAWKKKTKVDTQLTEENKPAKSKITNSIISSIISSCKHIGFDIVDDKIVVKDQVICPSNIVDTIHKLEIYYHCLKVPFHLLLDTID